MKTKLARVGLLFFITFTFTYCVDDTLMDSQINAGDASRKRSRPIANAGSDIIIKLPTNSTILDGSLSTDRDGVIKKYQWNKISGPDNFTISDPSNKITALNNLIDGIYTFQLTVTDDKNLTGNDNVSVTVNKDTSVNPPSISSFSPTSGIIGTNVIITGTHFGVTPAVSFNGTPATIITSSETSITTTVPTGATTGTISITTNGATIKSTSTFTINISAPISTTNTFYFQGNMDNVTITNNNSKLTFNGWSELQNHPYVEDLVLNNIGGIPYAFQEIRQDPVNPNRKVMYAQIIDDDPTVSGTTRAQMSLRFKAGVDLSIYHTSYRIYLNPDISYLTNYSSSITWFTLFEIWNEHVAEWDGDGAGSSRWNLSINKASGAGQPLYWKIKSEYMQPANIAYNDIWAFTNKDMPIPLGKWFTLDLYMKRGEGTNGRMTLQITPDGEPTTVLFDIINTTIYPGHPELQLSSWQPFKLYLNDIYLDWMRSNNKIISAYYNDFKWYEN